jgi:phosphocarrier protein
MDKTKICEKIIKIENKLGLHARPAAMFVSLASKFDSEVFIEKEGNVVNGKSIMGVLMLAAACGTELKLIVEGNDSEEAMQAIIDLVRSKFNEE